MSQILPHLILEPIEGGADLGLLFSKLQADSEFVLDNVKQAHKLQATLVQNYHPPTYSLTGVY